MIAKLSDGFEIEINEESANDWELLELFSDIDEGETGLIVKAARRLFGKEGVSKLKEHLRNENGIVQSDSMIAALNELMESVNELKNS